MTNPFDEQSPRPAYCQCYDQALNFFPFFGISSDSASAEDSSPNRTNQTDPLPENDLSSAGDAAQSPRQHGLNGGFADWHQVLAGGGTITDSAIPDSAIPNSAIPDGTIARNRAFAGGSPSAIKRVILLSVHTCPLALMGGKKTGGMNVYVRDFARTLAKEGVQVDIFTRSQDACQPTVKHDIGNNGRVIHIAAGPETPIPAAEVSLYIDEFVDGVCRFIESEIQNGLLIADAGAPYDLIHSHYWISGLVALQLSKRWNNIPIVHMFHTLGEMKNQIATSDSERAPQYRIDGEIQVVQGVDRLIAATPSEEEQLVRHYGADSNKIRVLPPGVDLEHFRSTAKEEARQRLGIPLDKQNILFAGRIEPLKGIDTLLQAAWLLKTRHGHSLPGLTVTIIGGAPHADTLDHEMARLQEITGELNLYDVVTFAGAKDQALLPNYYAAADVVVMPSHYESFGMVALEAMAMGRAVIASEVGGLAHLVSHGATGFHIPPRDAETLATRLFELLMDDAYRKRLGAQAKEYAQQFDWEKIVAHMQRLYAECCAQVA